MKNLSTVFASSLVGVAFAFAGLLSGCATTGASSNTGFAAIANHREAGFATDLANATKTGISCSENFLGVVTTGDSTIEAAKLSGGITKVASVDYDYYRVIGFYGKVCTIVKGE